MPANGPEKIYRTETGSFFRPTVTCQESPQVGCNTPYIRMDLYDKLKAENEQLREALGRVNGQLDEKEERNNV